MGKSISRTAMSLRGQTRKISSNVREARNFQKRRVHALSPAMRSSGVRRAAFRAPVHGGTAAAMGVHLFHLGQIESAGRWVSISDRYIDRTAFVLDGGDGHTDSGVSGSSIYDFSPSSFVPSDTGLRRPPLPPRLDFSGGTPFSFSKEIFL